MTVSLLPLRQLNNSPEHYCAECFLNQGKIEAEGSHEELLKKCEEYKKLYEAEMRNDYEKE